MNDKHEKYLIKEAKYQLMLKLELVDSLETHLRKKGNLSDKQKELLRNVIKDNTYSKK